MSEPSSRPAASREVLESWKEIAAYLGRSVRAVQLWEKEENLPIHRHQHDKQGTVFAYCDELDRWRRTRSTEPPALTRSTRRYAIFGALLAVAVIVTVAAIVWNRRSRLEPTAIRSLAVLPFTNSAHAGEHVIDGLTELLIDDLAGLSDLRVMSRSSVFRYKASSLSPARSGQALSVDAVVTGDVREAVDRYGVRVELIDVRDGAQIWARRYESPTAELPALHGRVASDLARLLRGAAPAPTKYSARPEAYEEYLLGLRDWNRRSNGNNFDRPALASSVRHFERAIDLDPKFAAAHAGLANAFGMMVAYDDLSSGEGTLRVLASARKALELDPNNAEAYTSVATASFFNVWDFAEGERDYRRAIALNPNYATAHQWYALALQALGRFAEGRREMDLAYRLDPLSGPITADMCWSFYHERQFDQAIQFANDVQARDPARAPRRCAAASLIATGNFDAVFGSAGRAPNEAARDAYRSGGVPAFYRARLEHLLGARNRDDNGIVIAATYASLGDFDHAFEWLEKAFERRDSEVPAFHLDPAFDAMRDDPRFTDLARRVGTAAICARRYEGTRRAQSLLIEFDFQTHPRRGRETFAVEEREQLEVAPGDVGSNRSHADRFHVRAELRHQRVRDALAA
jgi:TolB-like protein